MSIRLDWQIDSEDEVTHIQEDARTVATRKRGTKRFRNLVIVVAVISLVVGGFALSRLQKVAVQRRADLEAIVTSEALALRIGDWETFLSYQEPNPWWQEFQREVFREYETLGNRLSVDGEILEMDIDANLGRVVLRETLDGEPYRVTWFYEYFPEDGWHHVPPIARLLGRIRYIQTEHLEVFYRNTDEEYTQALTEQMQTWMNEICQTMLCTEQPRLTVFIVTEPLHQVSWQMSGGMALRIPSPATARILESSPLEEPTLRAALAEAVARRAAMLILSDAAEPYSDGEWLRNELTAWLASELDETQPGSEVITPLIDLYGQGLVVLWAERVRAGEPPLPTLSRLSGNVLTTLPITWDSFFEHRLRAEFRVENRYQAFQNSRADFVPEELAPPTTPLSANAMWHSIQVETISRDGNAWWVESTIRRVRPSDTTLILITKFLEVDGDWVLTPPDLIDWHSPQRTCSEHVCIHAFALDAPAAANALPALEAAYAQALDDLAPGLPERQLAILVVPSVDVAGDLDASPDAIQVLALSPHAAGPVVGPTTQEYIQNESLDSMMSAWVIAAAQPLPDETPVVQAFANWELARLRGEEARPEYPDMPSEERVDLDAPSPLALSEYHGEGAIMDNVTAWALLEAVETVYGEEVMGPLLDALPQTPDMQTWLATVGGSLHEIEPLWEELLIQALNDAP